MVSVCREYTLDDVENTNIGSDDGFVRFILFRLYARKPPFGRKIVLRGLPGAENHPDVFDHVEPELSKTGFFFKAISGGAILIFRSDESITVYVNAPSGYGRSDPGLVSELLREKFKSFEIGVHYGKPNESAFLRRVQHCESAREAQTRFSGKTTIKIDVDGEVVKQINLDKSNERQKKGRLNSKNSSNADAYSRSQGLKVSEYSQLSTQMDDSKSLYSKQMSSRQSSRHEQMTQSRTSSSQKSWAPSGKASAIPSEKRPQMMTLSAADSDESWTSHESDDGNRELTPAMLFTVKSTAPRDFDSKKMSLTAQTQSFAQKIEAARAELRGDLKSIGHSDTSSSFNPSTASDKMTAISLDNLSSEGEKTVVMDDDAASSVGESKQDIANLWGKKRRR